MQLGNDYNAWHRRFQPEETGRDHGQKCIPKPADTESDWENAVRSAVRKTIEDYSVGFGQVEGGLAAQFERTKALYDQYRNAYKEKSSELRRELHVPLGRRFAVAVLGVLALATAAVDSLLAAQFLTSTPLAVFVGVLAALGFGAVSYFAGHTIRQTRSGAIRWLTVAGQALHAALLGAIAYFGVTHMAATDAADSVVLIVLLAVLHVVLAVLGITIASYLMRDADALLEEYWHRYQNHLAVVAGLVAKREENRKFHIDAAQSVIKIAETLIHTYRSANNRSRGSDCGEPPFFNQPVVIEGLEAGDFDLHNPPNAY